MASNRGTRTRPLRSETRRRVLNAAAEVFAARGIASSSVSDIAEAAGLTKGAVYSNFDSKDDLVLALMEEHVLSRLHDAVGAFDAAFAAAADVGLAVHDLGASLVDAIHSDLTWQHLLFEYCVLARRDPSLRTALARRRREGRAVVAAAIDRIARAGGVELPMSAEELTVAMLAISNGLALETGMDPAGVPDDLFPRLIALIVNSQVANEVVESANGNTSRRSRAPKQTPTQHSANSAGSGKLAGSGKSTRSAKSTQPGKSTRVENPQRVKPASSPAAAAQSKPAPTARSQPTKPAPTAKSRAARSARVAKSTPEAKPVSSKPTEQPKRHR